MIRAFSFQASPERSRLRAWLEGTLAGLCELHLLRERQERRVRQALRIAAEPGGAAGDPSPEEQQEAISPAKANRTDSGLKPGWSLWQFGAFAMLEVGGGERKRSPADGFAEMRADAIPGSAKKDPVDPFHSPPHPLNHLGGSPPSSVLVQGWFSSYRLQLDGRAGFYRGRRFLKAGGGGDSGS
uniref:Uncharacterized protein n=1 Tax=Naja naja TaxID=35670 RepID=A0A8C6YA81_NAJNA